MASLQESVFQRIARAGFLRTRQPAAAQPTARPAYGPQPRPVYRPSSAWTRPAPGPTYNPPAYNLPSYQPARRNDLPVYMPMLGHTLDLQGKPSTPPRAIAPRGGGALGELAAIPKQPFLAQRLQARTEQWEYKPPKDPTPLLPDWPDNAGDRLAMVLKNIVALAPGGGYFWRPDQPGGLRESDVLPLRLATRTFELPIVGAPARQIRKAVLAPGLGALDLLGEMSSAYTVGLARQYHTAHPYDALESETAFAKIPQVQQKIAEMQAAGVPREAPGWSWRNAIENAHPWYIANVPEDQRNISELVIGLMMPGLPLKLGPDNYASIVRRGAAELLDDAPIKPSLWDKAASPLWDVVGRARTPISKARADADAAHMYAYNVLGMEAQDMAGMVSRDADETIAKLQDFIASPRQSGTYGPRSEVAAREMAGVDLESLPAVKKARAQAETARLLGEEAQVNIPQLVGELHDEIMWKRYRAMGFVEDTEKGRILKLPWYIRGPNALKALESTFYLASPRYVITNATNNHITALYYGLSPLADMREMKRIAAAFPIPVNVAKHIREGVDPDVYDFATFAGMTGKPAELVKKVPIYGRFVKGVHKVSQEHSALGEGPTRSKYFLQLLERLWGDLWNGGGRYLSSDMRMRPDLPPGTPPELARTIENIVSQGIVWRDMRGQIERALDGHTLVRRIIGPDTSLTPTEVDALQNIVDEVGGNADEVARRFDDVREGIRQQREAGIVDNELPVRALDHELTPAAVHEQQGAQVEGPNDERGMRLFDEVNRRYMESVSRVVQHVIDNPNLPHAHTAIVDAWFNLHDAWRTAYASADALRREAYTALKNGASARDVWPRYFDARTVHWRTFMDGLQDLSQRQIDIIQEVAQGKRAPNVDLDPLSRFQQITDNLAQAEDVDFELRVGRNRTRVREAELGAFHSAVQHYRQTGDPAALGWYVAAVREQSRLSAKATAVIDATRPSLAFTNPNEWKRWVERAWNALASDTESVFRETRNAIELYGEAPKWVGDGVSLRLARQEAERPEVLRRLADEAGIPVGEPQAAAVVDEAVPTSMGEAAAMPSEMAAYIKTIRNPAKRKYAEDYARELAGGSKAERPADLSYMAAQAVQMRMDKMQGTTQVPPALTAIREAHTTTADQLGVTDEILERAVRGEDPATIARELRAEGKLPDSYDFTPGEAAAQVEPVGMTDRAMVRSVIEGQEQAAPKAVKDSWQMTRREYIDDLSSFGPGYREGDKIRVDWGMKDYTDKDVRRHLAQARKAEPDTVWDIKESGRNRWRIVGEKTQTAEDAQRYADAQLRLHRTYVEDAIKAGKPVPGEVLAEYPEFATRPLPPATAAQQPVAQRYTEPPAQTPAEVGIMRQQASQAGIATITEQGAPYDTHLINALNERFKIEGLPLLPTDRAIATTAMQEMTPQQWQVATDELMRRAEAKRTGVPYKAGQPTLPLPEAPDPPTPVIDHPDHVLNREQVSQAWRQAWGLSDEEADAVMAVLDARARVWARQTGQNPADWYGAHIAGIRRGTAADVAGKALFQRNLPTRATQKPIYQIPKKRQPLTLEEFAQMHPLDPYAEAKLQLDMVEVRAGIMREPIPVTYPVRQTPYEGGPVPLPADYTPREITYPNAGERQRILRASEEGWKPAPPKIIEKLRIDFEVGAGWQRNVNPVYLSKNETYAVGQLYGRDWAVFKRAEDGLYHMIPAKASQEIIESAQVAAYEDALSTNTLFQRLANPAQAKGATAFLADSRAMTYAFGNADISTAVHESAHIFRRDLARVAETDEAAAADLKTLERWAGAKEGRWTRDAEEKVATGFEEYLASGKAPTRELQSVFERFKEWLLAIYRNLRDINGKLTPEVRAVFDRMLAETDSMIPARSQKQAIVEAGAAIQRQASELENMAAHLAHDQDFQAARNDIANGLTALRNPDYTYGQLRSAQQSMQRSLDRMRQMIETAPKPAARTGVIGKDVQAWLDPATPYNLRYEAMELDDLIASHTPDGRPNPAFPAELQPRARDQAASRLQIQDIASHLSPAEWFGHANTLDRGSPIIGPDNLVESGNGRIAGVRLASPETYAAYRQALAERAAEFGLDPKALADMRQPVLVRRRMQDVDRVRFVWEAAKPATLQMNVSELAAGRAAALTLGDMQLFGQGQATTREAISAARNADFGSRFLSRLSPNEQAGLVDGQGVLNAQGVDAIYSSLFSAAFPNNREIISEFIMSPETSAASIGQGINVSLGKLATLQKAIEESAIKPEYGLAQPLSDAVMKLVAIREGRSPFRTVEELLAQGGLFGDDIGDVERVLLRVFEDNKRSGKAIGQVLNRYVDAVMESGQTAGTLFEMQAPAADDLMRQAMKGPQGNLFDEMPDTLFQTMGGAGVDPATLPDATPPNAADRFDLDAQRRLNEIDALQGALRDGARVPPEELTPEARQAILDWADTQVAPRFEQAKLLAANTAGRMTDDIMLNYGLQYWWDTAASFLFPYHYWYTRSAWNWMQRLLHRPGLAMAFNSFDNEIQRRREEEGLRPRFQHSLKVPLPEGIMPDQFANELYVNPMKLIVPFANWMDSAKWDDAEEANNTWDKLYNAQQAAGLNMHMGLQQLLEGAAKQPGRGARDVFPPADYVSAASALLQPYAPNHIPPAGFMFGPTWGTWDLYVLNRALGSMAANEMQLDGTDYNNPAEVLRDSKAAGKQDLSPLTPYLDVQRKIEQWMRGELQPDEITALRDDPLAYKAMRLAGVERAIPVMSSFLTALRLRPILTGEKVQTGVQKAKREMGYGGAVAGEGGSRADVRAISEANPFERARMSIYGTEPGEKERKAEGVYWWTYEEDKQNEINDSANARIKDLLTKDPTNDKALDAIEDERHKALKALRDEIPKEDGAPLLWSTYGANPQEVVKIRSDQILAALNATGPTKDEYTGTDGKTDWNAYFAAQEDWYASLPSLARANPEVQSVLSAFSKLPGAQDRLLAQLATRQQMEAYDRRFHDPLRALHEVVWDAYKAPDNAYWDEIGRRFGDDILDVQSGYFDVGPKGSVARRRYREAHPQLLAYWDNKAKIRKAYPAFTGGKAVDFIDQVLAAYPEKGWTREELAKLYATIPAIPAAAAIAKINNPEAAQAEAASAYSSDAYSGSSYRRRYYSRRRTYYRRSYRRYGGGGSSGRVNYRPRLPSYQPGAARKRDVVYVR